MVQLLRGTAVAVHLWALAAMAALPCAGAAIAADAIIVHRALRPPIVDGDLGDACWEQATPVDSFTLPRKRTAPAEPLRFRASFDDSTLYCAFSAVEPHPQRLVLRHRTDSEEVWQDDCVELFARAPGVPQLDYDQFIVNAAGARWSLRYRGGQSAATPRTWSAAARVGEGEWRVEMALPLAALGLASVRAGQFLELKLGREDHTGPGTVLSTWPPGTEYGGGQEYGRLYLGDPNVLADADVVHRDGSILPAWSATAGDEVFYQTAEGEGRHWLRMVPPGRYSALSQSLALEPETSYELSAELRGTARVYLRARSGGKPGAPGLPHTAWFEPDSQWRKLEVPFATGADGRATIILGSTEDAGQGSVELRHLQVVPLGRLEIAGPAIPVAAGGARVVVSEVLVADSRAVRGFVGTPFDGTRRSRSWSGDMWEYPMPGGGVGVDYAYRGNDGLHVRLADSLGFDALQVRGGIRADLYAGTTAFQGPGEAGKIHTFGGRALVSRALFERRVLAERVSFFGVGDGVMADVAFLRVGGQLAEGAQPLARWRISAEVEPIGAVGDRFAEGARRTLALDVDSGEAAGRVLHLEAGAAVHLLSPPLPVAAPLVALELVFRLVDTERAALSLALQDPIDPRLELTGVDIEVAGEGVCRLVLDHPDQIAPAGRRLWVTLESDRALQVGELEVIAYATTRENAQAQALSYRKFLLKTFFIAASEARPWNRIGPSVDLAEFFRSERLGDQVAQIFETVEHCLWLDPDDGTARQYEQWLWRNRRGLSDFEPHLHLEGTGAGAPEWARWVRAAWLAARRVPAWWLDERLVPTGEFGGLVGDDSDMYQNYVDFAFFEEGGLAARLKEAGARLAELAERTTLEAGINRRTMDPLHAYEEGLNQEALMAVWNYGDPVYLERCMEAARAVEELTVETSRGHRHFRSQQVGAAQRQRSDTDSDGHAHPLMWHPAFEVLWYNDNPRVERVLRQWADGWLEHMRPGEYATEVSVADERVVSTTHRPLYGGYGGLGSAFAFLAWITGDERYVAPFYETYALGHTGTSPPHLVSEFLHRYGAASFGEALPALLPTSGAAAASATGDKQPLIEALKRDVAELERFPTMYTEAEPFTDRVFLYAIANAAMAYTGGYASRNKFNRSHAVSWSGFGTEYAALVLAAAPDHFKALVYNFREEPIAGAARFWSLDHGRYALNLGADEDGDDFGERLLAADTLEVVRGVEVPLKLAARRVHALELKRIERLDDLSRRADLALSPLDIYIDAEQVRGFVHNIGGARAPCALALVDMDGRMRARRDCGPLEAPLDLEPRRASFAFELPAEWGPGWALVADPDGSVEEIYEGNNRVGLEQIMAARALVDEVEKGMAVGP